MTGPDATPPPRRTAVTRSDVARYAGVSTAVVSYVLNNGPKPVADATAARVRNAIEVLGYRANSTARALSLGSTKSIGLVVPDSSNPFWAEYVMAIQRATYDLGYALLMTNSGGDPAVEVKCALDLCDRQVDGLIMTYTGATHGEMLGRGIRPPTVLIDSPVPVRGQSTIGSDAVGGTAAIVEHLLRDHHHSSVALLIGDIAQLTIDGREHGWTEAHARNSRPLGAVERAPFSRRGGYLAGLRLLQRPDRPTAILASSDQQALGLLLAAHRLGIRVPDEVAVASYDGTEDTEYSWPPLTTAHQRYAEMALAAVQTVLLPAQTPRHQSYPMDLIIRESCGCTPGDALPS